jgi:DNA mismatch endonuclease, patch repair protein
MVRQRRTDTKIELRLRSALHRQGLRFRVHENVIPGSRRTVDIVFKPARLAVEVRGCYWHACPRHGTAAKANAEWWQAKLEANVARDLEGERLLQEQGWELLVVWEHEIKEDVEAAADRVAATVLRRRTELLHPAALVQM